jgi:hypothetical protein
MLAEKIGAKAEDALENQSDIFRQFGSHDGYSAN